MRLPRRVPWAHLSELDQICSWIYEDEHDLDSKVLALNRLSAWSAITTLPHALESAQALLAVVLQDNSQNTLTSFILLRQSYAAAIIRFVNGLVDPLQVGAYARSIASIAAQLGIPGWLVELRHAATHENLPSLDLLRQAAQECMTWLFHHYFLPMLNPSSVPPSHGTPLRPIEPILKRYKSLRKMTMRDISLRISNKTEVSAILREAERWIAEAKVVANMSSSDVGDADEDIKERLALHRLCDGFLGKGGLVPCSKKKRTFPADSFLPPPSSVTLWSPFLQQLQSHHPEFPFILTKHIVAYLLSGTESKTVLNSLSQEETRHELSFDICLARWVMWIIETWNGEEDIFGPDLEKYTTTTLVTTLGPTVLKESTGDPKAAFALLQALCARSTETKTALSLLLPASDPLSIPDWVDDDMKTMKERLGVLLQQDTSDPASQIKIQNSSEKRLSPPADTPPGWRLLTEYSGWKPSPIGVCVQPFPGGGGVTEV